MDRLYKSIWWHAHRIAIPGIEVEDLFQAGCLKALEHAQHVQPGDAVMQRAFVMQRVAGHLADTRQTVRRRRFLFRQYRQMRARIPQPDMALVDTRQLIDVLLTALSAKEREVIIQYFFYEQTLKAIGQALGITESRASFLRARALYKMGRACQAQGILSPADALA